ncbi:MAG: polysaccharide deacetylase family protein [Gemmatimonadetes bacterium]|nr:polysaccharide deacetylase family protein [Gemmatimonadota bacterium]
MLSRAWYVGLELTGVTALARRLRSGGLILCYHNVEPAQPNGRACGDPAVHLPLARFESQIRWLTAHYRIVPLDDLVRRVARRTPVHRTVAITFDDAYAGVFEHAWPVLRARAIPATVFVVAEAPGTLPGFWWDHPEVVAAGEGQRQRWLHALRGDRHAILPAEGPALAPASQRPASWDVIRAAARAGLTVGSHSASHRTLTRLTDDELEQELTVSRDLIYENTGVTPQWFAYPYGIWDRRVRNAVAAAGYRGAVTLDGGLNQSDSDQWSLRRVNVPASLTAPAFHAWAAGLAPQRRAA